jgi:hypothetical protein
LKIADLSSSPSDYTIKFSDSYIAQHTRIPSDADKVPRIIGWCGPSRSGSTALLYLLMSHPQIDRAYFQPQTTLGRNGSPDFVFHEGDRTVCMKEVFVGVIEQKDKCLDPVKLLLKAGVPKEKITWIILLRDPVQAFSSLYAHVPHPNVQIFTESQEWSLALFDKYRRYGIKVIPFAYELAQYNEARALKALIRHAGLAPFTKIEFDADAISRKLVPGQMGEKEYFESHIEATFERKKYVFSKNDYQVPHDLVREVRRRCQDSYRSFYELAKTELGL